MILTKIFQRRIFITEKFALLNILKALEGLSGGKEESAEPKKSEVSPPPAEKQPAPAEYNAMANILARHEKVANKVRNTYGK